jgi:hypothetical protein
VQAGAEQGVGVVAVGVPQAVGELEQRGGVVDGAGMDDEGGVAKPMGPGAGLGGSGCCGGQVGVQRRRRKAFVTTLTLDIAMAPPATIGLSSPKAARGSPMTL